MRRVDRIYTYTSYNIYVQDESRFWIIYPQRKDIKSKGGKTDLYLSNQNIFKSTYIFGAFSPINGDSLVMELPQCNGENFQIFLNELSCKNPNELKVIVLDNGKSVEIPENIVLVFLTPYSPELNPAELVWLLFKTIYDDDVIERSRYDMSFKYFLEMVPEDDVINPSSLTKFRKLRLKDTDLMSLLIGKTVAVALEKGIIKSKSIIVDATHSKSRSNPFSALHVLKERSKILRKTIYEIDENAKENLPTKNTDDNLEHELSYCTTLTYQKQRYTSG